MAEHRHHPGQGGEADQDEENAVRQGCVGLIPAVEYRELQQSVQHRDAQPEFEHQAEQNGQQKQPYYSTKLGIRR